MLVLMRASSRAFLPFLTAFLSASSILPAYAGVPETATKPPNILWIVGENFALDLGCYGANQVHTPNLDRLAAAGIRYDNVFSTSPVCAPADRRS